MFDKPTVLGKVKNRIPAFFAGEIAILACFRYNGVSAVKKEEWFWNGRSHGQITALAS